MAVYLNTPVRRRTDEREAPAGDTRDGKAFTRAERDAFLFAAREDDPGGWRMWTVQVLTGLRPGELYALTEADLLLDQVLPQGRQLRDSKTLSDDGKRVETTPKGGKNRMVDLSATAVGVLRAQLAWRKEEKLRRGWREMPLPSSLRRTAVTCCPAMSGSECMPCSKSRDCPSGDRTPSGIPMLPSPERRQGRVLHREAARASEHQSDVRHLHEGDDASRPGALDDLDPTSAVTKLRPHAQNR
jgi:hypothetical protein